MIVGIPNLEKPENTDLVLPEIPEGFIRLTHFTSQRIAERLMAGENFTYGFLSSTVDSFSDNVQILELIKTGKTGNFSRERFETTILVDPNAKPMDKDIW